MELTIMQLYWIIKLDVFQGLATGLAIITGLVTMVCVMAIIICSVDKDSKEILPTWKKVAKYFIPMFMLFLAMATFLPTTKEMAALIVLPKIINNEKIQEIPNKVLDLGLEWLDELKPTKQESQK